VLVKRNAARQLAWHKQLICGQGSKVLGAIWNCVVAARPAVAHDDIYQTPMPGTCRDDGVQGLLLSDHVLSTVPPVADFSRDPVRDGASLCPVHHSSRSRASHNTGPHSLRLAITRAQVLVQHRRELIELGDNVRWVGYLSSTSVYGDHGGGWVDER